MKKVSIVVPVLNEEDNIKVFCQAVVKVMEPLDYDYEILFVDDGSTDRTVRLIKQLASRDRRVKALVLAKNFGHQTALTCGMDHAEGDAVITMDGDLQHPPELIVTLLDRWEQGFEVVQTVRLDTDGVSAFKKISSKMFYRIMNGLSDTHIAEGGSDFRLLDRRVVKTFRAFKEKARFIRGIIGDIGYRQTQVEFVAPKRFAGRSKFSLRKMLRFALDGITSHSKFPLRLALYLGICFGLVSFGLTLAVVYIRLFTQEAVPGWATTAVSILMLGGIQLVGLGIIGEYVGRIFEEVKERPLYWLRGALNVEQRDAIATYDREERAVQDREKVVYLSK